MATIISATVTGYNVDSNYNQVFEAPDTVYSSDQNTELSLQTSGATGDSVSVDVRDANGNSLGSSSYSTITSDSQVFDSNNSLYYLNIPSGTYTVNVTLTNASGVVDATQGVQVQYTNYNGPTGPAPSITAGSLTGYNLDSNNNQQFEPEDTITSGDSRAELKLTTTGATGENLSFEILDANGTPQGDFAYGTLDGDSPTVELSASVFTSQGFAYGDYTLRAYLSDPSTDEINASYDIPVSYTDAGGGGGGGGAVTPTLTLTSTPNGTLDIFQTLHLTTDQSLNNDIASFFDANTGQLLGRAGIFGGEADKNVVLAGFDTEVYAVVTTYDGTPVTGPDGQPLTSNTIDLKVAPPTVAFDPLATVGPNGQVTFTGSLSSQQYPIVTTSVELYNDGVDLGAAKVAANGNFSLTKRFGPNSPNGSTVANITAVVSLSYLGNSVSSDPVQAPYALIVGEGGSLPVPTTYAGAPQYYNTVQYTADELTGGYDATFYDRAGNAELGAAAGDENGNVRTFYFGGSFFDNKPIDAFSQLTDGNGDVLQEARFRLDGSTVIDVNGSDQTVNSIQSDTINNHGVDQTYVFTPGFGQDRINNFNYYNGAQGHDTVDLNIARPQNVLGWINNHVYSDGSSVALYLDSGDVVTLNNVLDPISGFTPRGLAKDLRFTG